MKDHDNNSKPKASSHSYGPRGMMRPGEKPKNFKKSIGKLLKSIKPFYGLMIISLIFAIAGTAFNIVGPKLLGNITNEIQISVIEGININLEKIMSIGILLIALYIISFVFSLFQGLIMNKVSQNISKNFRSDISHKINKLPLSYFDTRYVGDVLSIVTNDIDTIGRTLNQSLSSLIISITTLIGVTIMMFTISWQLTVVVFVSLPVSALFLAVIMKFSQKYFKKQQSSLGKINGHIEENYSGHNIIKSFNASKKMKEKFNVINNELYESAWKSQFYSGIMMPIMNFISNLSYVAIAVVGGILAVGGKIMIGGIQSMLLYVQRFKQPISQIAQALTQLQSTAAAAERVFEFLDEKEMSDENNKYHVLENVKGKVEFKNVRFGYLPEKVVIKSFSAKALPGQKIAIVGPTGAGKTTIVNLLMAFYEVNEGDILIDDISTKLLKRENIRNLFGMVLQDTWLFAGTIEENIAYSKQNASLEDVKRACEMANISHFIESLPGGYQMILDDDSNISQGQRQLLTIARAMLEDAPMLILDEATSNVDTRTEILIQEAMDKLMKGRTTFVIAHRLSTIKNADLILVMNEGNIIEIGNHQDLLSKSGFYADLYNSQFDKNIA